jgi:phage gp36-like protein
MNYRPVFIGGCDRSGTTLLGDLLGSSPWTLTTPESQFMHELLLHLKLESFTTPLEIARWLQSHFRFAVWDLPMATEELERIVSTETPRQVLEGIVQHYARHHHALKQHADVWVDHTPDNFKYHAMLKAQFPEARFIHIVRDGRAICASIKGLDWGPNNAYTASRHWADRLQQALVVESAEGDNCLRVRYEDLVNQPAVVMEKICHFIDIPFDTNMLKGGGLKLPKFTQGQHRLVGSTPQASRATQWRDKLSHKELRDFESYPFSRTLLQQMGYTLEFTQPPVLSRLNVLGRYCHEFAYNLLHRYRHQRMERRIIDRFQQACKQTEDSPNISSGRLKSKLTSGF